MNEFLNALITKIDGTPVKSTAKSYDSASLRAAITELAATENALVPAERRVTQRDVETVASRSLTASAGLDRQVRFFRAYRDVAGFVSMAIHGKVRDGDTGNRDLLPVGHPLSERRHAMTASAHANAIALWVAADPRIDEAAREIVAAAYIAPVSSIEYLHATTRLRALTAGAVPQEILLSLENATLMAMVAVGNPFTGGNSSEARSLRARAQRKDRKMQFAEEGGGIQVFIRDALGKIRSVVGQFVANSQKSDGFQVEVRNDPTIKDGIIDVPASQGEALKAFIPLPKGSPAIEATLPEGVQAIDIADLEYSDAPNGWTLVSEKKPGESGPDRIYKTEDGYSVAVFDAPGADKTALNDFYTTDAKKYFITSTGKGSTNAPVEGASVRYKPFGGTFGYYPPQKMSPTKWNFDEPFYFTFRDETDHTRKQWIGMTQTWGDVNDLLEADQPAFEKAYNDMEKINVSVANSKAEQAAKQAEYKKNALAVSADVQAQNETALPKLEENIGGGKDALGNDLPAGWTPRKQQDVTGKPTGPTFDGVKLYQESDRLDPSKAYTYNAFAHGKKYQIWHGEDGGLYSRVMNDNFYPPNYILEGLEKDGPGVERYDSWEELNSAVAAQRDADIAASIAAAKEVANTFDPSGETAEFIDSGAKGYDVADFLAEKSPEFKKILGELQSISMADFPHASEIKYAGELSQKIAPIYGLTKLDDFSKKSDGSVDGLGEVPSDILPQGPGQKDLRELNLLDIALADAERAWDEDMKNNARVDGAVKEVDKALNEARIARDKFIADLPQDRLVALHEARLENHKNYVARLEANGQADMDAGKKEDAIRADIAAAMAGENPDGATTDAPDSSAGLDPDYEGVSDEKLLKALNDRIAEGGSEDNLKKIEKLTNELEARGVQDIPVLQTPEQKAQAKAEEKAAAKPAEPAWDVPDGAHKLVRPEEFEPEGRFDEESPDFTDDPKVLANKFSTPELQDALAEAIRGIVDTELQDLLAPAPEEIDEEAAPKKGKPGPKKKKPVKPIEGTGAGRLQFKEGEEFVPAEAIYNALVEQGIDAQKILADLYDYNTGETKNADILNAFRNAKPEEVKAAEPQAVLDKFDENVRVNEDVIANPEAARQAVNVSPQAVAQMQKMAEGPDSNPHINEIADYLANLPEESSGEGNYLAAMNRFIPWAVDGTQEEKDAFMALWGIMSSLDGGYADADNPQTSSLYSVLYQALKEYGGVTPTLDEFKQVLKGIGTYEDWKKDKTRIANGDVDIAESNSSAALSFRLLAQLTQKNKVELYRGIQAAIGSDKLAFYTTEGNVLSLDPRSFSTDKATAGGFAGVFGGSLDIAGIIFTVKKGDGTSVDVSMFSPYEEELEHLTWGDYRIVAVKSKVNPEGKTVYNVELQLNSGASSASPTEYVLLLKPNDPVDFPGFEYSPNPEPYVPMGIDVPGTPAGVTDNPGELAKLFSTDDLKDGFESGIIDGSGKVILDFPADGGHMAVVDVEAVRDALQIQGVDTNELLKNISKGDVDGSGVLKSDKVIKDAGLSEAEVSGIGASVDEWLNSDEAGEVSDFPGTDGVFEDLLLKYNNDPAANWFDVSGQLYDLGQEMRDNGYTNAGDRIMLLADAMVKDAGGETPAAAKPSASAEEPSSPDGINIAGWTKVGGQAGSNPGGFYEDENGNKYYVKYPQSDLHGENEALASELYKLLGIDSAEQRIARDGDGNLVTVSPIIPGSTSDLADRLNDPEYKKKLQEGFAIDAWLANWDVAGLVFDNVVTDENGNPVRVDPGGALLFRAMGNPKGDAFGDEVSELDTLRDPNKNSKSAAVFGDMTDAQQVASAQKLLDITPDQIDELVDSMITDPAAAEKLKSTLKARRDYILERYGLGSYAAENVETDLNTSDPIPASQSNEIPVGGVLREEDPMTSTVTRYVRTGDDSWINEETGDDATDYIKFIQGTKFNPGTYYYDGQVSLPETSGSEVPETKEPETPAAPVAPETPAGDAKRVTSDGAEISIGMQVGHKKTGETGVVVKYDKGNAGYVYVKYPDGKIKNTSTKQLVSTNGGGDGGNGGGGDETPSPTDPEGVEVLAEDGIAGEEQVSQVIDMLESKQVDGDTLEKYMEKAKSGTMTEAEGADIINELMALPDKPEDASSDLEEESTATPSASATPPPGAMTIKDSTGGDVWAGLEVKDKNGDTSTVLKVNKDGYAYVQLPDGKKAWRSGKTLTATGNEGKAPISPAKVKVGKVTPAGVAPVIVEGGLDWDTSAIEGTPSLGEVIDNVLNGTGPSRGIAGGSAAVDSDSIEDLDVRVMHVQDENGVDGVRLKFKLTAWAGNNKVKELLKMSDAELAAAGIKKFSGIKLEKINIDENGVGRIVPGETGYQDYKGQAFRITTPDGITITIYRANTTGNSTISSSAPKAFHNLVQIQAPAGASQEQIADAIRQAGVVDTRPATPADARVLIENRLMSIFDAQVDATKNLSGDARAESLKRIFDKYGITPDDVTMAVGASGRIETRINAEGAQKIVEATGNPAAIQHNISTPYFGGFGSSATLTPEEREEKMAEWIASLLSTPQGGLLSTTVRWTEGIGGTGMSSHHDVGTGGADYVFTKPVKSEWKSSGGGVVMYFDPAKLYERLDFYANYTDKYGKRFATQDILKAANVGAYELMFKNRVSYDAIKSIVVQNQAIRTRLITLLRQKGITEIGGMPLEQAIIAS